MLRHPRRCLDLCVDDRLLFDAVARHAHAPGAAVQAATEFWYRAVAVITALGHRTVDGVRAAWSWLVAAWHSVAARCAGGWHWTRDQAARASGSVLGAGHALRRTVTRSG